MYMCNSHRDSVVLLGHYHAIISNSRKTAKTSCLLSRSIPPCAALCRCVSIRLSLCLSCNPSIISISPRCAVLFRLIASPAPLFLSLALSSLCSCSLVPYTPFLPHHCTSIVLPLLASILFLPLPPLPSRSLSSFMSQCIMLFLICLSHLVICWVFLSLSLCSVFHLLYMMQLSSFRHRLSLHVLMLQCALILKAISTFNTWL